MRARNPLIILATGLLILGTGGAADAQTAPTTRVRGTIQVAGDRSMTVKSPHW